MGGIQSTKSPRPSPPPLLCFVCHKTKKRERESIGFPLPDPLPLMRERKLIFCGDCEGDCFDDAGAGGGVFRGADGGYDGVRAGFCCAEYQRVARQ